MPISLTGQNKRKRRTCAQAGFTLIEVMVVMLIIGLMVGAVALSLPARRNPLEIQSKVMASQFRALAQSSMVDRASKGIRLTKTGYQMMSYQNGEWAVVQGFDYDIDPVPEIRLVRNGTKINLDAARKLEGPMVSFDATGLATPFTITMEDGETLVSINSSSTGEITYKLQVPQ